MWNLAAMLCGGIQFTASVAGWRNHLMSRGMFIAMASGSFFLFFGSWLDVQHRVIGIALAGVGLYLISSSTRPIDMRQFIRPKFNHSTVRAVVGLVLLTGLVLS